jgi:ABC-2 type transport system ATP-binding protein
MTTMTATRTAISVTGLRKSFGDNVVLDGIDLNVAEGAIFSLLGPNGAGKTTMVHILSTLITADGGEMWVAGHDLANDPDAVRAAIGGRQPPHGPGEPAADGGPAPPAP